MGPTHNNKNGPGGPNNGGGGVVSNHHTGMHQKMYPSLPQIRVMELP